MRKIEIRPAIESDFEAIEDLYIHSIRSNPLGFIQDLSFHGSLTAKVRPWRERGGEFLVAECDGSVGRHRSACATGFMYGGAMQASCPRRVSRVRYRQADFRGFNRPRARAAPGEGVASRHRNPIRRARSLSPPWISRNRPQPVHHVCLQHKCLFRHNLYGSSSGAGRDG